VSLHPQATARERAACRRLRAPAIRLARSRGSTLIVEREVDPRLLCAHVDFRLDWSSQGRGIERRAALASAAASESNLGLDDDERWLLCLPLSHVAGLSIMVRMLTARRAVVLMEPARPVSLLACMISGGRSRAEVTLVSLVPTLLERLLRDGFTRPPALRAVLLGGAGCSPDLASAPGGRSALLTSYGLTETGSQIARDAMRSGMHPCGTKRLREFGPSSRRR